MKDEFLIWLIWESFLDKQNKKRIGDNIKYN